MKSRSGSLIVIGALCLALLATGPALAGEKYKGFERGDALVTVQELKTMLDAKDAKLVVLAVARPDSFKLGHIPGSVNVWRSDYEPAANSPYPFEGMMLNRLEFEKFAQGLGVSNDSKVVLYDEEYDATRLWWAFYSYGKTDIRVLDGGYQAWKAAGYDVARELLGSDKPAAGNFTAKDMNRFMMATMYDVWRAKVDADMQLWDTRGKKEWSGEELKKGAYRKGRIPWATYQDWKNFKMPVAEGENFTAFKPAADVQKVIDQFKMDPKKKQVFYCQSGVRTTTGMFALYLMGWDPNNLMNYDGSWIEWSYFEQNPIVADVQ